MDYSLFTEQQLQKKYYFLPKNIKAILDSENNIEIARQICRVHHLNDEGKILIVEQLIGLILLGFVSADDLSREISENIHLNKQHADDISLEINRKIFAPIKNDIEKVYAPLGVLAEEKLGEENAPLMEISKEQTIDLRQIVKQREEVQLPKIEVVKIVAEEEKKPIGEVESFDIAQDKPVIIHKEAEVKPILGIKKSLGGLFNLVGKKEERPKPIEAQVEIGANLQSITDNLRPAIKIEKQPMRVVHYTEMRTPLLTTNNLQQTTNDKQFTTKLPEQILPPPSLSPQPVVKKTEPIVVKKAEEPLVVSKTEPKKEEGMIDLSTLRKI